uniref:Zgc:66426 n=1 Tax=Cyprinus carpio TaxID=7962 RepID=A0A8C2KJB1_CYPCA
PDFSDGVMTAEVVKYFFPKLVELHNYTATHSTHQKLSNWSTLNRNVFFKLNFHIPEETVKNIVVSTKIEEKQFILLHYHIYQILLIINLQPLLNIMYSKCFTLLQILQIQVDRLEQLVHLKDLRIEDLTKHLERYKARNS